MPRHSARSTSPSLVLYDGDCALCQRTVRFARRRAAHGELQFIPLQSPQAREVLTRRGLPTGEFTSLILIEPSRASLRSTAVLRLCRHLSMPWPMLALALLIPRPLRDWCYSFIARQRNRLRSSSADDPT